MDVNYLQRILSDLSYLTPDEFADAEKLKILTVEAFKQLFPKDSTLIRKIDHLQFAPVAGIRNQFSADVFMSSRNVLAASIAAKIENLQRQPAAASAEAIIQQIADQRALITQHESTIASYGRELKDADDRVKALSAQTIEDNNKISHLEAELDKKSISALLKNGTLWGGICAFMVAVPLWTFDRGKDFGYRKVDEERLQQKDSIKIRNQAIEYMRHNSDSAHNILGHMPYSEMNLDTNEFKKVQSTIENAGAVLYLNQKYIVH